MGKHIPKSLGWHQDLPDYRLGPHSPQVNETLAGLERSKPGQTRVDLREYFPAVRDQQHLPTSAAHSCIAVVEYFQRRAFGEELEPSRLFLHQAAERTGQALGLPGLDLRSHLRAMVAFGMPPERHYPYEPQRAGQFSDPLLYSFREPYRSILYVKLDARNGTGQDTLKYVKAFLAAGFPCAFGLPVPSSLTTDADILYRPTFDSVRGGQAVVAVGYDDDRRHVTRGALLIRSSWGTTWGDEGHGWLPYAYVEERLASCFWTLLKKEWTATEEFRRPHVLDEGESLVP